jgi:hypothetical protein
MKEEVLRLTRSLLVVKFDTERRGLLLKLPVGAEVCVLGSSVIPTCLEIVCNDEHYSIFERDLSCYSTDRPASIAAHGETIG